MKRLAHSNCACLPVGRDSGINKNKEDGEIPKDYGMHIDECRMQETIRGVKGCRIAPAYRRQA